MEIDLPSRDGRELDSSAPPRATLASFFVLLSLFFFEPFHSQSFDGGLIYFFDGQYISLFRSADIYIYIYKREFVNFLKT